MLWIILLIIFLPAIAMAFEYVCFFAILGFVIYYMGLWFIPFFIITLGIWLYSERDENA